MQITVKKYDPSIDASSHNETYDVPYKEHMTAFEAIVYVNENCEPLAFDYSCRGRTCGRCAIMFDGEPALACVTTFDDGSHTIEPLAGQPVIRDLAIDRHNLHLKLSSLRKRVRTSPITDDEAVADMDPDDYSKASAIEWCARCGVCNAGCPVLNMGSGSSEYVGPAGMIAIASRFYDPNDQGDRVVQAVQEGLFACIQCGKCDEVCKALEIDHQEIWKDLRAAAAGRGLEPADE